MPEGGGAWFEHVSARGGLVHPGSPSKPGSSLSKNEVLLLTIGKPEKLLQKEG